MTSAMLLIAALFITGLPLLFLVSVTCTRDRVLARIVALAYLVRAMVAVGLYCTSLWSLPVLENLQLGQGFWIFAPDSAYFHEYARGAAVALAAGLELPFVSGSPEYPLVVTIAYRVLGSQPLVPIWLNIGLASLTVLLVYSLARSVWSVQSARTAAALVAFWPSSVLWATQLLKDTIETFLIVTFLWAFHRILASSDTFGTRDERVPRGVALIVAFVSLFAAVRFRVYVGLILVVSALAVLAARAVADLWRRRYGGVGVSCAIAVWLACSIWTATWIPVEGLGKPDDPLPGLKRLAAYMVSIGDVEGALWQLQAARAMQPGAPYDRAERERLVWPELQELLATQRAAAAGREHGPAVSEASFRLHLFGELSQLLGLLSLSSLADFRRAFFGYGGSLLGEADDVPRDVPGLVRSAPEAFANALFSPNPWTPFKGQGSTGLFRQVAMIEVLLVAMLLYFSSRGLVSALQRAWPVGLLIALFSLLLTAALGYAIPNVGILFRLRLAVIVPLCILTGGSALPDYLVRARAWAIGRVIADASPA